MARRSVLFSPGDDAEKLRKAPSMGADVVVFDLEDGVAPDWTERARATVREVLDSIAADCEVCVRVNPVDAGGVADVEAVFDEVTPDSVMIPKASGADDVDRLSAALDQAGAAVPVLALVESAAGVLAAEEIAAAGPTDAVLFGAEDLAGDLGATRTESGDEVASARQHVLLAARAAGVDAIDTHYPAFEDETGLREAAHEARDLGYDGKMAIHPAQVPIVNEAFTPDPERVAWARRILDGARAADAEDRAVFVVDGEMIDAPQVRQAERLLERAGAGDETTEDRAS